MLSSSITSSNLGDKRKLIERSEKWFKHLREFKISRISSDEFQAEIIKSQKSEDQGIILYIHGGGFVLNLTKIYRGFLSYLSKYSKLRILSIDYKTAPENAYPTALNEAFEAYKWVLNSYPPNKISIGGDSAGGSLVLSLIHKMKDSNLPLPACIFLLSPLTDCRIVNVDKNIYKDWFLSLDELKFFNESYMSKIKATKLAGLPLKGSFKDFPPILIHVDKAEIVHGDSLELFNKASADGADVKMYESEGLFHVWHVFANYIPEAKSSLIDIAEFVRANIS